MAWSTPEHTRPCWLIRCHRCGWRMWNQDGIGIGICMRLYLVPGEAPDVQAACGGALHVEVSDLADACASAYALEGYPAVAAILADVQ